jgi:subtilase family serine protease
MQHYSLKVKFCSSLVFALLGVSGISAQRMFNRVNQAQASTNVQFDVFLPGENSDQLDQLIEAQHTKGSPSYRRWLTPQQFQAQFGPNPAALANVADALAAEGLSIESVHTHGLRVTGTVTSVQHTFGITLWNGVNARGRQKLVRQGAMKMPAALQQAGALIPAFLSVPDHKMHSRVLGAAPENRYSAVGPYWFTDIKQAYKFPSYKVLTGANRTIAIVISSDVLDSDLALYFGHEQLPTPKLVRVPVLGGSGPPNPSSDAILEASLDVQQSGGMAPGATIAIYDIPDLSDDSILAAYQTIVDDNSADIVSSSFGLGEPYYTAAYNGGVDFTYLLQIYHDIFRQASAQGITFVASSGDNGGYDAESVDQTKYVPSVDHPASDPNVTGVGGTNLVTTYIQGSLASRYVRENAYFDPLDPAQGALPNEIFGSGGGKSIIFSKPDYQNLVDTGSDTRAVPDISLEMGGCPVGALAPCGPDRSSVVAIANGLAYGVIGTSVSAPEFAGLLALEEEYLGTRLGNVNYEIYLQSAAQISGIYKSFHQGIPGDNGVYQSQAGQKGYNMVVGNGTPIGIDFILAPGLPVARKPESPSNP